MDDVLCKGEGLLLAHVRKCLGNGTSHETPAMDGFTDFSIVDNPAKLLDALNRLDGQKLRKVFSKRDERGYTILHVAAERNQTESLKCLVIKNG